MAAAKCLIASFLFYGSKKLDLIAIKNFFELQIFKNT